MNDIARIAFVTAHFEELKGLKIALYGAGLLFGSLLLLTAAASGATLPSPFMGFIFAGTMLSFGTWDLEPRYRNTFGSIVSNERWATVLRSYGLATVFAMQIGPIADMAYQAYRPGPSVAALAIGAISLLVVVRDWRWRIHYLVTLATAILAAVVTAAVPPGHGIQSFDPDPVRAPAFLIAYALLGFGLVFAGVFDHRLLATTLGRSDGREDPRAWRRTRPLYVAFAGLVSACGATSLSSAHPSWVGMILAVALSVVVCLSSMFVLITHSRQRSRGTWQSPYGQHGFLITSGDRQIGVMVILAVAATIDATLVPGARPFMTPLAFSACSLAAAASSLHRKLHYLIGAAAGFVVVMFLPRLAPSQSFALFVCVAAGSLAVEWGIDLIHEMKHANAV